MQEPCRSCARRDRDHGGCRCQAMALASDPHAADPVCHHAPARPIVDHIISEQGEVSPQFIHRAQAR
jgi:PqqA peptide cyclase